MDYYPGRRWHPETHKTWRPRVLWELRDRLGWARLARRAPLTLLASVRQPAFSVFGAYHPAAKTDPQRDHRPRGACLAQTGTAQRVIAEGNDAPASQLKRMFLDLMAEELEHHGVGTSAITMPLRSEAGSGSYRVRPTATSRIRPTDPLLRLRPDELFQPESIAHCYYNSGHMGIQGAEIFSHALGNRLADLIRKGEISIVGGE